eukprot:SAG22_NODE_389_length_11276_cov_12.397244_6_plen_1512_part_00
MRTATSDPGMPLLELIGQPLARSWSLLGSPLAEGARQMRLMHGVEEMSWRVGDRVALAPTKRQSSGDAQSFVIDSFGNNTIRFARDAIPASCTGTAANETAVPDCAAAFANASDSTRGSCATGCTHIEGSANAANQQYGGEGRMRSEVVNLARSILITGDDFRHEECGGSSECVCNNGRTRCTVGLHTIMHGHGTLRMSHTRVEKCGQRGIQGRYCVHLHFTNQCPECLVHGNAVEFSQQRGVIIHETHLATITENILYNVRGANYYIEDGNEMHNTLAHNIAICPNSLNGPLAGCTIPGTDNGEADTCLNQAGIWSLAHQNNFIGNRNANSFNGLLFHSQFAGGGRGAVGGKVCTAHVPFGRVIGNTNHGHGRFGQYFLVSVFPRRVNQVLALNGITSSESCKGHDSSGNDRGRSVPLVDATDYDNTWMGSYSLGDLQYQGHNQPQSANTMYWKETKNMADRCSAHILDSTFGHGFLSLPDARGTVLIENSTFRGQSSFGANHHCGVGVTGMLCNPQYIFHNVDWHVTSRRTFVFEPWFVNDGGIFALAPPDARGNNSRIFPPGFHSLVGGSKTYLLGIRGNPCSTAADAVRGTSDSEQKYARGILCRRPVRRLNIWSRGLRDGCSAIQSSVQEGCKRRLNPGQDPPEYFHMASQAPTLQVRVYEHNQLVAQSNVEWWQIARDGQTLKQGWPLAVALGDDLSYSLALADRCVVNLGTAEQENATETTCSPPVNGSCTRLTGLGNCTYVPTGDIPSDWVIEFSDNIMGNRFGVETLALDVQGRECGGHVTSQHDRKWLDGNQGGNPTQFGLRAAPPPAPRSVAASSGAGAVSGLSFVADCDVTCVGLVFTTSVVQGEDVCAAAGCGAAAPFVGLSSFGCSGAANSWGGDCCNVNTCVGAPAPPPPPPAGPAPPPGATDYALGAAATASSGNADRAVDGNDGSRWESAFTDPQWLELDLGSVRQLCAAQIKWEAAYSRDFMIQKSATGSVDAEDWSPILTVMAQELPHVRDQVSYILTANSTARYVRFYGTARATVWGHSFWRLSLFSVCPEGSGPPPPATDCTPPVTEGYDVAGATGATTPGPAFNVLASSIRCVTPFGGTPNVSTCASAGTPYNVSGCDLTDCIAPTTPGYIVSGATSTSGGSAIFTAGAFDVLASSITCDSRSGFTGTATVAACDSPGAPYTVGNCTSTDCVHPGSSGYILGGVTATDGGPAVLTAGDAFDVLASSITCAPGHVGSPTVTTCDAAGGAYTVGNCSRLVGTCEAAGDRIECTRDHCDANCHGLNFSQGADGRPVCDTVGCGGGAPFVSLNNRGCSGNVESWSGNCCDARTCSSPAPSPTSGSSSSSESPPPPPPPPPPSADGTCVASGDRIECDRDHCEVTCIGLNFSLGADGRPVCDTEGCGSGAPYVALNNRGCSGNIISWAGNCCDTRTCDEGSSGRRQVQQLEGEAEAAGSTNALRLHPDIGARARGACSAWLDEPAVDCTVLPPKLEPPECPELCPEGCWNAFCE